MARASVWQLSSVSSSLPIPGDAVQLLNLIASFDHRQFAGGRNVARVLGGERWRAWHQALCRSADVEAPDFVSDGITQCVA